jgi:tetratricopeptide (TPR) repeat protein
VSALLTRTWHSVSKIEFISYFAFAGAILLSVLFARDQRVALFGEALDPMSSVSLLALPAIVYLVRTLPDTLRRRVKYVLAIVLGVSAFILMASLMISGTLVDALKQVFSGFSNATSFAVYLGVFVLACFFFVRKAKIDNKYKAAIVISGILFLAWIVSLASSDAVRPNFTSSFTVGKAVMMNDGVFGIGAGDYDRAWQLYRPLSVISSPYFGYEFNQGFSTVTTLFTTVGIMGLLGFLMLVLSALYSTYKTYRQTEQGEDKTITGFLALVLVYLSVAAWVVPLSYALLVVWMVIAGLGLAKARLSEYHPSRKLAFLMIPLAVLLVMNVGAIAQKTTALISFSKAQKTLNASGPTEDVGALIVKAGQVYPYDGFSRAYIEYIIAAERVLVSNAAEDQEALKTKYLENAQTAVNAGLDAVRLNGSNYQNYVSLGRAYELAIPFDKEAGYTNAKKAYEEAVKLYPNNPYLYVMLARLEASAGTKDGVRLQLTEALKKKQNYADALYLMSQLEASDQKIDEALAYAVEAVKNAPEDPLVYIQAGLLFYGKKDYQNAVTALNTALEKDPNNANVAYFLALALRDGGRPDLAQTIADELLKRAPDNADIQALVSSLTSQAQAVKSAPAKK